MTARLLIDAVRESSWNNGAIASLLQLNLQVVHHGWLIYTLRELGLPVWLCEWVGDFLAERTATLTVDGKETVDRKDAQTRQVNTGVPQDFPLSPILFIFFTTPFFREMEKRVTVLDLGVQGVGIGAERRED